MSFGMIVHVLKGRKEVIKNGELMEIDWGEVEWRGYCEYDSH